MQWQEHKCSNPSLSNSNKENNAYGGRREEEQGGNHKELQDLNPQEVLLTKRRF
jgi:hypothetical protein